jgi:hypothetical protein
VTIVYDQTHGDLAMLWGIPIVFLLFGTIIAAGLIAALVEMTVIEPRRCKHLNVERSEGIANTYCKCNDCGDEWVAETDVRMLPFE